MIKIPVSIGEAIDKITILQIKKEKISDSAKNKNIVQELLLLQNEIQINMSDFLVLELKQINEKLWDVENQIRKCEQNQNFGQNFIQLARSVYTLNDKRNKIKREINLKFNSKIIEEKSYE
jgi:hypothetical protein